MARINLARFTYIDTKSPSAAGPPNIGLSFAGQSFKSIASGYWGAEVVDMELLREADGA